VTRTQTKLTRTVPPSLASRVRRVGFAGADIALAALVVLVVGLMIVPLPTWTLDLLISANLSAAVAILLVVLYVPDAIGIATFPTLLLLTTLFRLALNVASTRLILLQANAGEVIRAFGTFVVRGNYVVGAVVFSVLTIIQFIVIAKGSERVAEVGGEIRSRRDAGQADGDRRRAPGRSDRRQRGSPAATAPAARESILRARWTER